MLRLLKTGTIKQRGDITHTLRRTNKTAAGKNKAKRAKQENSSRIQETISRG
jgi:hypothetical protein